MDKKPTTIIGIDPGTMTTGYAIIETLGNEIKLLAMGNISLEKYDNHYKKLTVLFSKVYGLITQYEPDAFAIEAPFYANNAQSLLKLGRAQGVAMAATMTRNIPVFEYSPKKVKQSVTGNGNASKEQVAAMVKQILKGQIQEDFIKLDATDALGVALCHFYQSTGVGAISGGSSGGKKSSWGSFLKENPGRIKG